MDRSRIKFFKEKNLKTLFHFDAVHRKPPFEINDYRIDRKGHFIHFSINTYYYFSKLLSYDEFCMKYNNDEPRHRSDFNGNHRDNSLYLLDEHVQYNRSSGDSDIDLQFTTPFKYDTFKRLEGGNIYTKLYNKVDGENIKSSLFLNNSYSDYAFVLKKPLVSTRPFNNSIHGFISASTYSDDLEMDDEFISFTKLTPFDLIRKNKENEIKGTLSQQSARTLISNSSSKISMDNYLTKERPPKDAIDIIRDEMKILVLEKLLVYAQEGPRDLVGDRYDIY